MDILIVLGFIIVLFIIIFVVVEWIKYSSKNKLFEIDNNDNQKNILKIAKRVSNTWQLSSLLWNLIDYAIVILSSLASLMVVYIQTITCNELWVTEITILLSIVASILPIIGFVANPKKQKQQYRKAFVILNNSLLLFVNNPSDSAYKDLAEKISKGEKLINSSFDMD